MTPRLGPPFVSADSPEATYFRAANRNKESIQLDLKAKADLAVLKELISRGDVLVEITDLACWTTWAVGECSGNSTRGSLCCRSQAFDMTVQRRVKWGTTRSLKVRPAS
jgi:CoA-transferase family III